MLPPDVHVQAPPNLADDFGVLLDAGIDDWGGVSPITADHVNPERPWPALDRLRAVTEERGFALAPRLTVYPHVVAEPDRWLDPALAFPVMDRADAEGLGRDDPGAVFPERTLANAKAGTGADVVLDGQPLDRLVLRRRRGAADPRPRSDRRRPDRCPAGWPRSSPASAPDRSRARTS